MILKFIFLIIIVVIATYLMFKNNTTSFKEHFTDDKKTISALIKKIYNDELHRDPSQKEIDFFYDFVKNQKVTDAQLREVIRDSGNVVAATFQTNTDAISAIVYGTEENVIEVFNDILGRNPDSIELPLYSKKVAQDPKFDIEKLKLLLYSTPEYKRMEKTQDNKTFGTLPGNVTDRQITIMINKLYNDVTGIASVSDPETLAFLKKKFVEFGLNEEIMKRFIGNYFSSKPFDMSTCSENIIKSTNSPADAKHENKSTNSANTSTNTSTNTTKSSTNTTNKSTHTVDEFTQQTNNQSSPESSTNDCHIIDGQKYCMIQSPNKKIIEDMLRTTAADAESQSVLDLIKKKSCPVYDQKSDETATDAFTKRNIDDLKNTCTRNKKYSDFDENLILLDDQRWSVPQYHPPVCVKGDAKYQPTVDQTALIGTLLEDASKTKVGNILPLYPSKH